jgi:hypothetical protein
MPTPIPTNYVLYLDPLLGFTPGGTTWQDQSLNENVYTFNNTNYTYENTTGSFLLPVSTSGTIATQNAPQPGGIGVGTSAKTIIAWIKVNYATVINGDFFLVYQIGRNINSGPTNSQLIGLRLDVVDVGPGGSNVLVPGVFNSPGYRFTSFSVGANTTYWQDSDWHMISYTKASNGTVAGQKLYVDGIELTAYATASNTNVVSTSVSNSPLGTNPRMVINGINNAFNISTIPATIGQLWIYDEVLTQPDLLNFYEQTVDRYYPPAPVDLSNGRSFQQGFNG